MKVLQRLYHVNPSHHVKHAVQGIATEKSFFKSTVKPFLISQPSWQGQLKQYPCDFIVRECNETQQVCHLETLYNIPNAPDPLIRTDLSTRPSFQTTTYLRAVLCKYQKSTPEALRMIAQSLQIPCHHIQSAGLKDRQGITYQWITLPMQPVIHKLYPALFTSSWNHQICLGNFEIVPEKLKIGSLQGNQFTIVIRNINSSQKDAVLRAVQNIQQHGFLNFFGDQRFGSGSIASNKIGCAILRRRFKEACDMIMHSFIPEKHQQRVNEARKAYHEKKFGVAFRLMPGVFQLEKSILLHLAKKESDYTGAIRSLPRKTRLLYARSYSSHLWNAAACYYLNQTISDKNMNATNIPLISSEMEGQYCSFRKFYQEYLQNDKLDWKQFGKEGELHLEGGTRKMIEYPSEFSYDLIDQVGDPLSLFSPPVDWKLIVDGISYLGDSNCKSVRLPDKMEELNQFYEKEYVTNRESSNQLQNFITFGSNFNKIKNESRMALKLQFKLNRGVYATSLLRELFH